MFDTQGAHILIRGKLIICVLLLSETGRKNHCRPLTPWTQPIPLWKALQISVRQHLQTQKQFLPPRRLTTEQLTHCSIYIYPCTSCTLHFFFALLFHSCI